MNASIITFRPNQKVTMAGTTGVVVELPRRVYVSGRWTKVVRVRLTSGCQKGLTQDFSVTAVTAA